MSIAEKITQIAGNEPKVYNAGKIALLKSSTHMKGTATSTQADNMLFLRDVSPVEHTMTVKLTGGEYKLTENLAVNFVSEGTKADGTPNDFSPYGIPVGWNLVAGQNYKINISGSAGSGVQDTTYSLPAVLCSTGYYALGYVPVHHEVDYGYLPFGIYTRDGDTTMYWTGTPQYENDYVSFSLSISTNVDTSYSTVTRYGKNIGRLLEGYDTNGTSVTSTTLITRDGYYCALAKVLPGKSYTISKETNTSGIFRIFYYKNSPLDNPSEVSIGGYYNDQDVSYTAENLPINTNYLLVAIGNVLENVQIEIGTSATDYEPYVEPSTYTQSLPDVVKVPSLYPTTVLSVDTIGATMECSYLRDIDTYIDNLIMNVSLTGGE